MKWALIVIAALALIIVVVTLIGYALPKKHTVSRTVRLRRSAEDVFDAISDYKSFPAWRADVQSVRELADGRRGWIEIGKHGELPVEVVRAVRPDKFVSRIADPKLPFAGTWTWQIKPDGPSATHVTVTEDGEVYNPIFRFMSRFVFGHTATMDAYLGSLARKFGEELTPVS